MSAPRIASLFTGTGALDLAVMDVYGGDLIWHSQYEPPNKDGKEDRHQWAAQILHRHWPTVPNLGDITAVDWAAVLNEHGPVDILTGGFPCQDISAAGKRAGLVPGTRSGLWTHMARAISVLQPRLVVIENVEGLLSRKAHRDLESENEALAGGVPDGTLRAAGAVLGDLASLGFDAEWEMRAASDDGATHRRRRVIINAWPAVQDADGSAGDQRRLATPGQEEAGRARADAGGRGGALAAHAGSAGLEVRRVEPDGPQLPASERSGRESTADAASVGRGEGRTESARLEGRPDAALGGGTDVDWGKFESAVRRWEHILGRRAPRPVDDLGRLNPPFVEWMMGLPAGWVVDTPGITRAAMLKALGNGVVRQQAVTALRLLRDRMPAEARLPLAAAPALEEAA